MLNVTVSDNLVVIGKLVPVGDSVLSLELVECTIKRLGVSLRVAACAYVGKVLRLQRIGHRAPLAEKAHVVSSVSFLFEFPCEIGFGWISWHTIKGGRAL